MYKKHIGHLLTVSLKYFFDLDFTYFHNAYLIILMLPFAVKLLLDAIGVNIMNGLDTVKDDISSAKTSLSMMKEHLKNNEHYDNMMNNIRSLKNNLTDRNFRTH